VDSDCDGHDCGLDAFAHADAILTDSDSGGCLGSSLSIVEDMHGDGYGDLLIADECGQRAFWLTTALPAAGELSDVASAVLLGEGPTDSFGSAMAAGDVDGDGLPDLVIGADTHDDREGAAYVFSSPTGIVLQSDYVSSYELDDGTAARFGKSGAVGIADMDGDGARDVVVGGGVIADAVWLLAGPLPVGSWDAASEPSLTELTSTALQLADLDGDGVVDLLTSDSNRSEVRWTLGPLAPGDASALDHGTVMGLDADAIQYDSGLAVPRDSDGDGYLDVAFGVTGDTMVLAGSAQLIRGPFTSSDRVVDVTWVAAPGDHAGPAVALGDHAGVGYAADIVVGASGHDESGVVYVAPTAALGVFDLGDEAWLQLQSGAWGSGMGRAVATGDLDGDGADELVVPVPFDGQVLIYGGPWL